MFRTYIKLIMRIISKQKDYYDSCMGYGHDPNIIWDRKSTEVPFRDIKFQNGNLTRSRTNPSVFRSFNTYFTDNSFSYVPHYFGICGKVFVFFEIKNLELYGEGVTAVVDALEVGYQISRKSKHASTYFNRFVKDHFNDYVIQEKAYDLFLELQTPVFYYTNKMYHWESQERYLIKDAILKHTPYMKARGNISDPNLMFQEISQFVGGVLSLNNPNTVQTDDLSRLDASGIGRDAMVGHNQPKKRKKKNKK